MKKVAKAMYGKSMMKNGGMKKMEDGGGVGKSKASGGKGSISDMTPNSSSGEVNGPNTIYAPGKKKTESTKTYKTGGSTKYQAGGMKKANTMNPTSRNTAMTALGVKKKSNAFSPSRFGENAVFTTGSKMMKGGSSKMKKYAKGGEGELGPVYTQASGGKGGAGTYEPTKTSTTKTTKTYKTGGMVNSNAKILVDKTPGSKGVMSGENPKASASKVAKGRSGGTSKAPKTATPKAMYGMSMKPGMMKMGGTKKK